MMTSNKNEILCILDCSSSMLTWQKLHVAKTSISLLVNDRYFLHAMYPMLSAVKIAFWGKEVYNKPPSSFEDLNFNALENYLYRLSKKRAKTLKVLLFSDGCGKFRCSLNLRKLITSRVRMAVVEVGPDSNRLQLSAFSSCNTVYTANNLGAALSEVMQEPLISEGSIEDDLDCFTIIPDRAHYPQYFDDEDEW